MKRKIFTPLAIVLNFLVYGQNIVLNGDFSNDLNGWTTFLANWENVNATYSAANEEANITNIVNSGAQSWWVQLNQILTPSQISSLVVGETYEISFQARSSVSGRPVKLFFGENGGSFAAVHIQDYQLSTTMDTYQATFVVNNTFTDMKLGFEMGLSNDDVYIDNVVFKESIVQVTTYPVTFKVDMANYSGTFTTPELNGTFNNWCGNCTPMVNTNGSIWEVTLELQAGSYEYKFSHDGWSGQENLTQGSSCTITTGNYTNRTITISEAVNLPLVCWESCLSCENTTSRTVTFRVDMANVPVGTFTTPEVNGTFNNWCGNCAPMTNVSGSIWELAIALEDGTYEYKFSHDNWAGSEQLTPGTTCSISNGEFTNRALVVTENTILPIVCWGFCVACEFVGLNEEELINVSIYPNPSNDFIILTSDDIMLGYTVYDFAGKVVMQNTNISTEWTVPIINLTNGIYNIHVRTKSGNVFHNFIKN
jgi:hypothetical protein